MSVRCETIIKYMLSLFRSFIAKELINNYKLTQLETAKKLGTTQAAISQYINSKSALKGNEQFKDIMPKLQELANETAKRLAKNEIKADEIALDFCKLCPTFSQKEIDQTGDDYVI